MGNQAANSNCKAKGGHWSVLALVLATTLSFTAVAGTPMPEIPKGKGDKCMDDTDVMRESHMDKLLHKRDRTMYQGVRTKQFSLKECISCHVVKGEDHKPVSAANPKHFCRVCHDYTSVKIDCFECHASKPRPMVSAIAGSEALDSNNMDSHKMNSHMGTQADTAKPEAEASNNSSNMDSSSTGSNL